MRKGVKNWENKQVKIIKNMEQVEDFDETETSYFDGIRSKGLDDEDSDSDEQNPDNTRLDTFEFGAGF